jgi:nucleoside-diphosphate-sugar epimerase
VTIGGRGGSSGPARQAAAPGAGQREWASPTTLARSRRLPPGDAVAHAWYRSGRYAAARAKGVSGYIGDGASRWPAVHVQDAATLYRLAIEQAPAGAVLNAVGDEGVPVREIAEAIGRHLNLPARSLPAEEYGGMLVPLLSTDMPASSTITQELLGWHPTHPGLIEDIGQGHYFT